MGGRKEKIDSSGLKNIIPTAAFMFHFPKRVHRLVGCREWYFCRSQNTLHIEPWGPAHHPFFFLFLTTPDGLQDLSSPTRIEPSTFAVRVQSPNHWTAMEFLLLITWFPPTHLCSLLCTVCESFQFPQWLLGLLKLSIPLPPFPLLVSIL